MCAMLSISMPLAFSRYLLSYASLASESAVSLYSDVHPSMYAYARLDNATVFLQYYHIVFLKENQGLLLV